MKKIGDMIPERFRNEGSSCGLQHPFLYGHDLESWLIWRRDTGYIAVVEQSSYGESAIRNRCYALNGLDYYENTTVDLDSIP